MIKSIKNLIKHMLGEEYVEMEGLGKFGHLDVICKPGIFMCTRSTFRTQINWERARQNPEFNAHMKEMCDRLRSIKLESQSDN